MRKIFCLLSTCLLLVTTYAQTPGNELAIKYLDTLLVAGNHKVEVLGKDIPDHLRQLAYKYRQSINDNMSWYKKYSQEHASEEPLPYHKNFGISNEEYDEMNSEFASVDMKVKSVKSLKIDKTGDRIQFDGDDNFTIFDAVVIDLKNNTVLIDEEQIPFAGEIHATESEGGITWSGYKWMLEEGSMDAVKAFKPVDYTMIELRIGKTTQTNKIVILYKTIYVEEGNPVLNGSLTAYIN